MYGLADHLGADAYGEPSLPRVRRAMETLVNEEPRASVRFKSVVCYGNPIDRFRTLDGRFNEAHIGVENHGDHYQIEVDRTIKRSNRRIVGSFAFFQHEESPIWTAFTANDADFFQRGLEWIFTESEPIASEFYVTSSELERMLDDFSDAIGNESTILVTKAVAYSHRDEGEISFKRRPYPAVFRKAREGGNYVDSVLFETAPDAPDQIEGKLTRNGVTEFSGGNVELFFNYLLDDYVELAGEKANLFSDRERSRENGEIEQIQLNFDQPVFQQPEDNDDLIEAMLDLNKSSVTVYHDNPYAHLSVLDFIDGSSCDVFVTDSETITIVPSYQGSSNALMRISNKIYTDLDESSVEVFEEAERRPDEFVAG